MILSCPKCPELLRMEVAKAGAGICCPHCNYLLQTFPPGEFPQEPEPVEREPMPPAPPAAAPVSEPAEQVIKEEPDSGFLITVEEPEEKLPIVAKLETKKEEPPKGDRPVPKMVPSEPIEQQPTWEKARTESAGSETGNLPPWVRYGALAVSALLLGGVTLFALGRTGWNSVKASDEAEETQPSFLLAELEFEPGPQATEESEEINVSVAWEKYREAKPVAEAFLAAETWQERIQYVREPERVRPLMERYYQENEDGPYPHRGIATDGSLNFRDAILALAVERQDFGEIFLAIDFSQREPRIDWESFVAFCDMSWEAFQEERPLTPQTFRVVASQDSYFNFGFRGSLEVERGEESWECFRLRDLEEDHVIYGYVRRQSDLYRRLRSELLGVTEKMMVLEIAYPENPPAANQVIIHQFVADGWVLDAASTVTENPLAP